MLSIQENIDSLMSYFDLSWMLIYFVRQYKKKSHFNSTTDLNWKCWYTAKPTMADAGFPDCLFSSQSSSLPLFSLMQEVHHVPFQTCLSNFRFDIILPKKMALYGKTASVADNPQSDKSVLPGDNPATSRRAEMPFTNPHSHVNIHHGKKNTQRAERKWNC